MSHKAEIMEAIDALVDRHSGGQGAFQVIEATVKSVDWDKRVCTVTTSDNYDITNVRLRAKKDGTKTGWVCKPKVNSDVLVALVYNKPLNTFIAMFGELDGIVMVDGNGNEIFNIDVPNGKFVFNGGNHDGMVKVVELTQKVNNLENKVNELINILRGVSVALAPSGTYPFAPIFTPVQTLTPTQQSDIEDTKITH